LVPFVGKDTIKRRKIKALKSVTYRYAGIPAGWQITVGRTASVLLCGVPGSGGTLSGVKTREPVRTRINIGSFFKQPVR
jgi:hypothetical protein